MRQLLLFLSFFLLFLSASPAIAEEPYRHSIKDKLQEMQPAAPIEQEGDFDADVIRMNPLASKDFPWKRPSIITQAITLASLAMSPFFIMILTSFAKIVIVLSLLRNALGTQQAPPNQVVNGIALLLTLFIMFPVATQMYDAAQDTINKTPPAELITPEAASYILDVADAAKEPYREFLIRNTDNVSVKRFYEMAYRVLPEQYRESLQVHDFIVILPAYVVSQIKDAFEVGVLIYIPFFVIDLVTSNILLAMGMMMLSPVTISLPLKIFLLVMLDGWTLLVTGLVQTYH